MKAYTDLKQSRILAKILPHDTADQAYECLAIAGGNLDVPEEMQYKHNGDMPFQFYSGVGVPCWSLASLLGILAEQDFKIKCIGNKFNIDIPIRHSKIWFSSLLDAAVEMVMWLKMNNKT